jgi:hypothetical protein
MEAIEARAGGGEEHRRKDKTPLSPSQGVARASDGSFRRWRGREAGVVVSSGEGKRRPSLPRIGRRGGLRKKWISSTYKNRVKYICIETQGSQWVKGNPG